MQGSTHCGVSYPYRTSTAFLSEAVMSSKLCAAPRAQPTTAPAPAARRRGVSRRRRARGTAWRTPTCGGWRAWSPTLTLRRPRPPARARRRPRAAARRGPRCCTCRRLSCRRCSSARDGQPGMLGEECCSPLTPPQHTPSSPRQAREATPHSSEAGMPHSTFGGEAQSFQHVTHLAVRSEAGSLTRNPL